MEQTDSDSVSPQTTTRSRFLKNPRFWLLAGVALLTAIVVIRPMFRSRLKVENFEKIQTGMTQQDVEALLGGPPGFYRRPREAIFNMYFSHVNFGRQEHWWGDNSHITVFFDINGRVTFTMKDPASKVEPKDWILYYLRLWE